MPNPPKPVERKRRAGNPGKQKLPDLASVHFLEGVTGVPEPLRPLEREGFAMWCRIWSGGAVWLAPGTDVEAVQILCEAMDEREHVRELVRADADRMTRVQLRSLDEQILKGLSALGFTPVDRARMGVAEVRRVSKLEALQAKVH
jgi:hypothetical protein